ncbi:MAG TPA: fumarylacetoacetate hydrolase, partial [Burkholderiales bacterium]|nr:fumarylacetoacetate hydrolase [Burkholderiales bacterium]
MSIVELSAQTLLPAGGVAATLVGRAWMPGEVPGPSVIAVRGDAAYDLTRIVPTISALLERSDAAA